MSLSLSFALSPSLLFDSAGGIKKDHQTYRIHTCDFQEAIMNKDPPSLSIIGG